MAAGIDNLEENWCEEGERSLARKKAKHRRCKGRRRSPVRRKAKCCWREGRRNVAGAKEGEASLRKAKRRRWYGRRSVTGAMEGEASPAIWSVRESGYRCEGEWVLPNE